MDLYSRVKLRGFSRKNRVVGEDIFRDEGDEFDCDGLSKCKAQFGKRRFSFNEATNMENQAGESVAAMQNAMLTSLVEVTVEENELLDYSIKDLCSQNASSHDLDQSDSALDEGTAIETLSQLREGRPKSGCNQMEIGDMVWGKITSHPWWPGQIYNDALASPSVFSTKKEGCVLVAFFGDYTYGWLDRRHLIPFDVHYDRKSKQTDDRLFLKAVKEATQEFRRRALLGLVCHCPSPSNFLPANVGGLFEVNFNGFISGGMYSAKQIDKARDDFKPTETLVFIKQMALNPKNNALDKLSLMKNIAKVHFCRRESTLQELHPTDVQPILQLRSSQDPPGALAGKEKDLSAFGDSLKTKSQKNRVLWQKRNVSWNWFAGDHGMRSKSKGSNDHPPHRRMRPGGATVGGEKHSISGMEEFVSMQKPVRQNTNAESTLKKEPEIEEPRMLIIRFPPATMLPSVSELKTKFERFGPFGASSIGVFWEHSTCRIMFYNKAAALGAYGHGMRNGTLFSSRPRYELQVIRDSGFMLPKTSQSLTMRTDEGREEIQPHTCLRMRAELLNEVEPSFQPLLLAKKMKSEPCVEPSENHACDVIPRHIMIPEPSSWTPLPCCKMEQLGIDEAMKNNDHHAGHQSTLLLKAEKLQ